VLVTTDERILVADILKNRVAIFSASDLSFKDQWRFTSGTDPIYEPVAIAQAPGANGNVFISRWNDAADYVMKFDHEGTYLGQHRFKWPAMTGLAVTNNNVFATSFYHGGVVMLNLTSLSSVELPPPPGGWVSNPWGIAADRRKGRVLVPDIGQNACVHVYSENGEYVQALICGFYQPFNIAVGPAGEIYVLESFNTVEYSNGIVTVYGTSKLKKFDTNGAFIGEYGGALPGAYYAAVGADGAVYVPEWFGGRIHKITCM
jgi:hypothetical protein